MKYIVYHSNLELKEVEDENEKALHLMPRQFSTFDDKKAAVDYIIERCSNSIKFCHDKLNEIIGDYKGVSE